MMNKNELKKEISKIVYKRLDSNVSSEDVDTCSDFYTIGLTSIGLIGVILEIEKKYSINFKHDILIRQNFNNLNSISQIVEETLKEKNHDPL